MKKVEVREAEAAEEPEEEVEAEDEAEVEVVAVAEAEVFGCSKRTDRGVREADRKEAETKSGM